MKKQEKKFVLAALVLLAAITMVLLSLAGCKNDTVPETPKYTVTFNTDGGSTVASQTVESGQKATRPAADPTLEGSWFLGWYSDEGLAKKFDFNTPITTATTVYAKWSYKLHTKPSIFTNYTSPHAPSTGTWTYVEFGDWPQTIKAEGVDVDETKSKTMGMFTCYLGSDGNHYVKAEENANGSGTEYKYSNGDQAGQGGTSTKWFKVEPIVWRVLTTNYEVPEGGTGGNALLLAEHILTGGVPYYVSSDTREITKEKETGTETVIVYPNNWQYSTVRAWLNGRYEANDTQDKTYTDKGFLQTAFTQSAWDKIAATTVDNSAASTNPASDPNLWENGENPYACGNTTDKIFLLSEEEATTGAHLKEKGITDEDYGFDEYSDSGEGSTRIRVTTDYAKATGAYQSSTEGYGGWWRLRSPYCDYEFSASVIYSSGNANRSNVYGVYSTYGGVVPALSISLQ